MFISPATLVAVVSLGVSAVAAGQAHVPAGPVPVSLKVRQATREQVVTRQQHRAAQRQARQAAPSINPVFAVPSVCGSPFADFYLQFLNTGNRNATEGRYASIVVQNTTNSHYIGVVDSLGEATPFTFDETCGLSNEASGRVADISFEADASDGIAKFFSGVFMDKAHERQEFNMTRGSCQVSGAALSCSFGVATEFSLCDGGNYYYLATELPGDLPAGCQPTSVQVVGSP